MIRGPFSRNQRLLNRYLKWVRLVNQREIELQSRGVPFLQKMVQDLAFKRQNKECEDTALLIDSCALVKNACRRLVGQVWSVCGISYSWQMIPYDVQIMGGLALIEGKVAEMATGEGKTLSALFGLFYHALSGRGVHLATANDFLALRDSQWMGPVFTLLGLRVGCIQSQMPFEQRKEAYRAEITYGSGKEFGFDYLRDHALTHVEDELVQRGHYYAIVDEADSLLIDEAKTPLIISGNPKNQNNPYLQRKQLIEEVLQKQKIICEKLLDEVEQGNIEQYTPDSEGVKLYCIWKGDPRNPRLERLRKNFRIVRLIRDAEIHLMRDLRRKRIKEFLNSQLYYIIDDASRNCYLTDLALRYFSETYQIDFILPSIESGRESLEHYEKVRAGIHALHTLLKAYVLYQKDVDYCIQKDEIVLVDKFTGRLLEGRRLMDGLHQAIEAKENVPISPESDLIASITSQNYFRLYEHLSGMTGTAKSSAAELHDVYQLEVVQIPTHRKMIRQDHPDVFFQSEEEKFTALVWEITETHKTGRPVLVGTVSVEKSEYLSRRLSAENIRHEVLNARHHEQEASIIALAGKNFSVTIATNMAGRGTDILIEDAKLGGLYVMGTERHESKRIDMQLRGRAGRQGDPGSSQFFISMSDDLIRRFGAGKLVKALRFLAQPAFRRLSQRLIEKLIDFVQGSVELANLHSRKRLLDYDDVADTHRRIMYELRDRVLKAAAVGPEIMSFIAQTLPKRERRILTDDEACCGAVSSGVVERLAFLGTLDQYWIQHLADLERLKEGMALRLSAHGVQMDQYRRESFQLFQTLLQELIKTYSQRVAG